MILDNLSIAGLIAAALYLLLPLLFGRETWRVDEASTSRAPLPEPLAAPTAAGSNAEGWSGAAGSALPCGEG